MANKECFIYGLRDPRTMEIRYVGQTADGMGRPRVHSYPSSLKRKVYVANWLRSIGTRPEIVVLERVEYEDLLDEAEIRWIAVGRSALGKRFTNATDGGVGIRGFKWTEEFEKLSEIARKREASQTPAQRSEKVRKAWVKRREKQRQVEV